jgi:uncharacterized protein YqhQ
MRASGIGGQAVLEGVMMRNRDRYAVAVRKPDQEITIERKIEQEASWLTLMKKIPIVRGVVSFVSSLVVGMQTLAFSASFFEDEDGEDASLSSLEMGLTITVSIVLAVLIFMLAPYGISLLFEKYIHSVTLLALVEGVIRLAIFLIYVWAISLMSDIKRVYMYHGAEHKCINCIEHELPLTVENVRKSSRFHKRCGTSFLLIVMLISIVFFALIHTPSPITRLLLRIVLIPVVAGVSYEFIRLAGKSDNVIVDLLSKPGLCLQRLTTKEPDDSMIEVGIASVEAVFDWKKFLAGAEAADCTVEEKVDLQTDAAGSAEEI